MAAAVFEYQVKRGLSGKHVHYECPGCDLGLDSPLNDAGKTDTCPECGQEFIVPGEDERRNEEEAAHQRQEMRRAGQAVQRSRRAEAAAAAQRRRKVEARAAPGYYILQATGVVLVIMGAPGLILGLFFLILSITAAIGDAIAGRSEWLAVFVYIAPLYGTILASLLICAAGQALWALRDIARNSFKWNSN